MKPFFFFLASSVLSCLMSVSPIANAGVVELTNGDRLEGEVVRIEGEVLVWNSKNFGEQRIKKIAIKNLVSNKPVKVSASRKACIIDGVVAEELQYYCGPRTQRRSVPLLTLRTLLPYEEYVRGKYLHTGRLNLWGAYSSGNEVRSEWNIQAETKLRKDEFRHVLAGEYANASWNDSAPTIRWNGRYSLDWFFRSRWFWYNNTEWGADDQRGLERYYSLGTGTGYQFWETHKTALSLQAGLSYVNQQYETYAVNLLTFDPHPTYGALRLATDFRYELPAGISFFHNNEMIYSFEDADDWQLKTSSGVSSMILSRIYSEFKVDYWIDNDPQPTKARSDTRMSVGVSYKW